MASLFGRQWALTVGGASWSGLRIAFEVQRRLAKHPDPAQITVYNLSSDSRTGIDAGDPIRLVAGYAETAGLVYSGSVVDVTGQRDGADFATTFVCRDGHTAWGALVAESYGSSAPVSLVVGRLVRAMGLVLAPGVEALLAALQTRGPVVQVGYARSALSTVLAPHGLRWCLQDGAVIVLPDDGATAEEAIALSAGSGLIGSPEPIAHGRKQKGRKVARLRLTSLLQPGLTPGRRVEVDSVLYSGRYRVDSVVHRGDSHGQDWYSVAEVRAL